jgi:polysaccharide pyruvyl transferase WcaK-like protein
MIRLAPSATIVHSRCIRNIVIVHTFYFRAKTQYANLGDMLISRELLALARAHGNVVVDVCDAPNAFVLGLDIRDTERADSGLSFWLGILFGIRGRRTGEAKVSGRRVYLLNPGGFSGEYSYLAAIAQLGVLFFYVLLWICGVKIMRVGCSLGPFGRRRKFLERLKSYFVSHIGVRDNQSLSYCNKIGMDNTQYFPDLAFLASGAGLRNAFQSDRCTVCLSFRSGASNAMVEDAVAHQLSILVRSAPPYVSFKFVTQVAYDAGPNRALAEHLGLLSNCAFVDVSNDLTKAAALYGSCDLVISNRLHVLLLALRNGASVIALVQNSANAKIVGLFSTLALSHLVVDVATGSMPRFERIPRVEPTDVDSLFRTQADLARSTFLEMLSHR